MLVLLFYKVPPTVVYEYPHPQNVQDRVYRDKNGVCYDTPAAEVSCDANEGTLRAYHSSDLGTGPRTPRIVDDGTDLGRLLLLFRNHGLRGRIVGRCFGERLLAQLCPNRL